MERARMAKTVTFWPFFFFFFFSIITLYTKNVKQITNTINSAPIKIYVVEGKLNVKKGGRWQDIGYFP